MHCSVHKGLWFLPNRKQLELKVERKQARKGCVESVSVQSVGTLEIGCPSACLTLVTAHRAAMRIQAGYVWINDASIHLPGASFGGYKQSGLGREESFQELHEFTQIKNINVSLRGSRP